MEIMFYIILSLIVFSLLMLIFDFILEIFFKESHPVMKWWRRNAVRGDDDNQ